MMNGPVFLRHLNAFEPFGKALDHILLKKPWCSDATVISLHRDRPPSQVWQHHGRDHLVIRGKFAFRDPVFREKNLVRMRDHDHPEINVAWLSRNSGK